MITFRKRGKMKKIVEWISIKDRLPQNEGEYLVYSTDDCIFLDYWAATEKGGEWLNCDNSHIKVTHWMLLPESPGSEDK